MVRLKHKDSGIMKECPPGFSWTMLFFGSFVPLFRGDVLWFIATLVASFVSFGVLWLVFPFIYNQIYIKGLLNKGFIPADEESGNIIRAKGWVA